MVRKVTVLLSLIIFIVFCSITLVNSNDSTKTVFNKLDEYYYDTYIIDVSNENINTKNIFDYFDGVTILKIYPNNNPIYSKFINIDEYEFDNILSQKKNISNFVSIYNNKLNDNALIKEVESFNISGIKINKLKVYTSTEQIDKVKELLPNVNIEECEED